MAYYIEWRGDETNREAFVFWTGGISVARIQRSKTDRWWCRPEVFRDGMLIADDRYPGAFDVSAVVDDPQRLLDTVCANLPEFPPDEAVVAHMEFAENAEIIASARNTQAETPALDRARAARRGPGQ